MELNLKVTVSNEMPERDLQELIHAMELWKYIRSVEVTPTQAETIAKLREALKPFTHDDLCEMLGGNVEGDESPVFNRNHAMLKLKDFRKARAVLSETEGK